jgi:hypothetical protein
MSDFESRGRPISEAPKDRQILGFDPSYPWNGGFCICSWPRYGDGRLLEDGTWWTVDEQTGESWPVDLTMWWELPQAPQGLKTDD